MIEPLTLTKTYQQSELGDGDIIIVEMELNEQEYVVLYFKEYRESMARFKTVLEYFEEYDNQLTVSFKPRIPNETMNDVDLRLSRKFVYPHVLLFKLND